MYMLVNELLDINSSNARSYKMEQDQLKWNVSWASSVGLCSFSLFRENWGK